MMKGKIMQAITGRKKGSAVAWIYVLMSLFTISVVYLLFTQVIYQYIRPTVITGLGNSTNITQAMSTIVILDTVWQYWPLILLFGLFLYGIVASMRREPNEYSY